MVHRLAIVPLHRGGSGRDMDRNAAPSEPVNLVTAPQRLAHRASRRPVCQLDTVPTFDGYDDDLLSAWDLMKLRR